MLLRVQYKTTRYDMIKDFLLEQLIASGKIVKFYRSAGWVFIGRDRIRGNGSGYGGHERRRGKDAVVT